ncbi:MAG: CaiB/BaiF CoA transferase family protein [Sphingomonadaceae bacterium]
MDKPLAGLRVIDFSWSLPGPFATRMLLDMGAEVHVVELTGRPEVLRGLPPTHMGENICWLYVNDGKTRQSLNIGDPEDVERITEAIGGFDIVVEQFRPGVMDAFGLGYTSLAARHPHLIYCSITGYGQEGPYRDRAGHDVNYMALSGVADGMRGSDGMPVLSALPFGDVAGGSLHAAIGILAALQGRARTGRGVHVDISMTHALWALNAFVGPAALNGAGEKPGTGLLDGGCFYGYYRTKDGHHLAVGGLEAKFVSGFFGAVGRPDLIEAALDPSPLERRRVRNEVAVIISGEVLDHWLALFDERNICVEPVISSAATKERKLFDGRMVGLDACSGISVPGPAIRFRPF